MATIVNNPPPIQTSDNGMGFLFGAIFLVIALVLFFVYVIPFLSNSLRGGPQINIPGKFDVNIQNPTK